MERCWNQTATFHPSRAWVLGSASASVYAEGETIQVPNLSNIEIVGSALHACAGKLLEQKSQNDRLGRKKPDTREGATSTGLAAKSCKSLYQALRIRNVDRPGSALNQRGRGPCAQSRVSGLLHALNTVSRPVLQHYVQTGASSTTDRSSNKVRDFPTCIEWAQRDISSVQNKVDPVGDLEFVAFDEFFADRLNQVVDDSLFGHPTLHLEAREQRGLANQLDFVVAVAVAVVVVVV
eukprot:CAMPEP_0194753302 /NCGR_PEP_ID=MMETSP0323_2-20130528/7252_1 /TAXON_ID=2866 ORGANISM="Crypthecodinium cohnii, Strain Seligo" /NCGR_SAMPLE_ID=MMETSP0323_2 /ASSEMBLY_ACC=CAM_ASM_000346 /LENGTH=235 /DNA_ID=CAMNT_0039671061 /DNA_START=145 /DNA_END=850 /DNA_ORIENTATION=-